MKTAIEKVIWVGRVTVFAVGLAVVLALTVGLATTALAAVPGDPFKLGKTNTINRITQLVGANPNNALLRIDNNSTGASATALDLQVEAGKPPMRVNSTTEVQGLNVDSLDGKNSSDFVLDTQTDQFFSGDTYTVRRDEVGPGGGQGRLLVVTCDPGDKVLGGGGGVVLTPSTPADTGAVTFSRPDGIAEWDAFVQDNGLPSPVFVEAVCADFPPLRP